MRGTYAGVLALLVAAAGAGAHAENFRPCPIVGVMPDYEPQGEVDLRHWDGVAFLVKDGDGEKEIVVKGAVCDQNYGEKAGKSEGTILENTENYKSEIQRLGGELKLARDGYVVGVVKKDGRDVWIRFSASRDDGYEITEVTQEPFKSTLMAPSGDDYRLLGHMPGFKLEPPDRKAFAEHVFPTEQGEVAVRGRLYQAHFDWPDAKPQTVHLTREEVLENYRGALSKLGAETLRDGGFGSENISARFDDHGQLIYIFVDQDNLTVIEEKPFQLSIKPPSADVMKDRLDKDGRVTLYVNFDFAKASLKPDAAPVIAEVVTLMKRHPELKLSVDGHTDSVGGHDYNLKLSQERAASVATAIAGGGVAPDRLASQGFGPDKPIAANDTDEGRAKNRRVELVKTP